MADLVKFPLGGGCVCVETHCPFSIILAFVKDESSDS